MPQHCEDCGCKVFSGRCTNCHEELYILDQYDELDMPRPDDETDFMQKVYNQQKQVSEKSNLKK